jgi:hypothetical protein
MLKTDWLRLPENWESLLDEMLIKDRGVTGKRVYICSPCRADSSEGVIQNMKAARVYMFYAYTTLSLYPVAPHAYLPLFLRDDSECERKLAMSFGDALLPDCDEIHVCGNRISEGMRDEIRSALQRYKPIRVYTENVADEVNRLIRSEVGGNGAVLFEPKHLHFAMAMSAEGLAPFWEV